MPHGFDDILKSLAAERQVEVKRLDAIFRDVTGFRPKLWGRMIGYGQYHYRYDSGREGDFLATGFTPRAKDYSLHILPGYSDFPEIAERLGPHSRGKSCWYIRRLADTDEDALKDLIRAGLDDLASQWPLKPT